MTGTGASKCTKAERSVCSLLAEMPWMKQLEMNTTFGYLLPELKWGRGSFAGVTVNLHGIEAADC